MRYMIMIIMELNIVYSTREQITPCDPRTLWTPIANQSDLETFKQHGSQGKDNSVQTSVAVRGWRIF